MSGRRVCTNCGATFHIVFNPTKKDGICDTCNANLIQRDDDKEETVISRLKTYHEQTEPLINFYSKRGKLLTVIGREEIEETSKAVIKVLGV